MFFRNMEDKEIEGIYISTRERLTQAKRNLRNAISKSVYLSEGAISNNVVPGYNSEKLDFGAYEKDKFAVLFVDMRGSTKRAQRIGAEKTFLTMHIFISALLQVVKYYNGYVIDIMGDGLMVFFKKDEKDEKDVINRAAFCGVDMLKTKDYVINKLLEEEDIETVSIGIGITYGDVIVTKIGISNIYDVKVFGDCVNYASKYSSGENVIKVSEEIEYGWPSEPGGKITFKFAEEDGSREVIIPR